MVQSLQTTRSATTHRSFSLKTFRKLLQPRLSHRYRFTGLGMERD